MVVHDTDSDLPRNKYFPLSITNILFFILIWVGTGFVLGTSLFEGHLRWVSAINRTHRWDPGIENGLVVLFVVLLVLFSFWLALVFVRGIIRSARKDVRLGVPVIVLFFTFMALYFWFHLLKESDARMFLKGEGETGRMSRPQQFFDKRIDPKPGGMASVPGSTEEQAVIAKSAVMRTQKQKALGFFKICVPAFKTVILLTPFMLLYTVLIADQIGRMRVKKNMRIPYTRKIFHFFIFTMAAALQPAFGLSAVVLFGLVVGLTVLYAVLRGTDFPFYEAIARQTDAPHSTFFVTIPLLSTAVGGLVANIISVKYAPIGYLITGWGDAIAEPVGSRWGRHKYKVPSLDGIHVTRSFEGSMSVLLVGTLAVYFWCLLTGMSSGLSIKTALLCTSIGTIVEGFSNHGLDNFTIQATVTAAAALWVG